MIDDTLLLLDELVAFSPSGSTVSTSVESQDSLESTGEFTALLNLYKSPVKTAEAIDLGIADVKSPTAPSVVVVTRPVVPPAPPTPPTPSTTSSRTTTYTTDVYPMPTTTSSVSVTTTPSLSAIDAGGASTSAAPPSYTAHFVSPSGLSVVTAPVGAFYDILPSADLHDVVHDPVNHLAVADLADSDSDSEMDSNISPTNLKGVATENAPDWLRRFENCCEYKGYDETKKKTLFKVVLTDSAAVWYDSLPTATTNSWAQISEVFKSRYTTPEFMRYQHANDLFNTKQGQSSVDDYCAKMQRLAKDVGADNTMLRFAVINELRADIRNHVTRTQPTDWQGLVDSARVGEMCVPVPSAQDPEVSKQLVLIQETLKRLEPNRSKTPTTTSVDPVIDRRSSSSSARRVRFSDEDHVDRAGRTDGRKSRYDV